MGGGGGFYRWVGGALRGSGGQVVVRINRSPFLPLLPACRRFLSSENFCSWYCVRREEANQKLRLLHLDMLCKAVSHAPRWLPRPLSLAAAGVGCSNC